MAAQSYRMDIKLSVFFHKFNRGGRSGQAFIPGCNFSCNFCGIRAQKAFVNFPAISTNVIRAKVREVKECNGSIKIGGQEATGSPGKLAYVAKVAKEIDCEVIVDTNGSNPEIVLRLAKAGLIDQVEVGLKGFSREQAMAVTGTGSGLLSWDNPRRLIRALASDFPAVRVLTSFVIWQGVTDSELEKGFSILADDQRESLYVRFTNVEDPIPKYLLDYCCKCLDGGQLDVGSLSGTDLRPTIRELLCQTNSLRSDLLPLAETEMVERIEAITKGTFWQGRTILVLNRIGHIGSNGTEGLVWL